MGSMRPSIHRTWLVSQSLSASRGWKYCNDECCSKFDTAGNVFHVALVACAACYLNIRCNSHCLCEDIGYRSVTQGATVVSWLATLTIVCGNAIKIMSAILPTHAILHQREYNPYIPSACTFGSKHMPVGRWHCIFEPRAPLSDKNGMHL